jgi:hypothetical protein
MQGAAQYALVLVEGLSSSSSPGLTRWSMMKRNSATGNDEDGASFRD